jgi:hypothetical protein
MITVLRSAGLSVVIYAHDHEPPHVHVIGDGEAKILLVGNDGAPAVLDVWGMKEGDLRKALKAVSEAKAVLLEEWERIHG